MSSSNPFFSDEHQQFQDAARAFCRKEASREQVRQWDRDKAFPYGLFAKVAELGWNGLGVPEELGGNGLDEMYMAIACEELGRWSSDIGGAFALNLWGGLNLVRWGTPAQKAQLLPAYLAGERRFSFSMTEPNSGSDSFSLITAAVDKGDHYLVNGEKIFSTAADKKNNTIMLATRTARNADQRDGLTIFLVPNDTPGIEITRLDTLARRIAATNRVTLTDVRVPKEWMLGPLDRGVDVLRWHLEVERITAAACYMGNAQGTLDVAVQYAKERTQFGQTIGSFQAIQHMLADMHTEVEASRMLVYRVAWMRSRGLPCFKEASVAKLHASETSFKVASIGMQVLGGYAQLPEFDMERFFRDSKQSMVGGGTSQIQRNIIAKGLGL